MTVERWCSMKEVCEHLGASHDSVVHWVKNNNLPAVKIGRLWRFKMSEVDEWLLTDDAEKTKAGKHKWIGKTRISFKPLFKLLIDRDIKKKDLAEMANISIATIEAIANYLSALETTSDGNNENLIVFYAVSKSLGGTYQLNELGSIYMKKNNKIGYGSIITGELPDEMQDIIMSYIDSNS